MLTLGASVQYDQNAAMKNNTNEIKRQITFRLATISTPSGSRFCPLRLIEASKQLCQIHDKRNKGRGDSPARSDTDLLEEVHRLHLETEIRGPQHQRQESYQTLYVSASRSHKDLSERGHQSNNNVRLSARCF